MCLCHFNALIPSFAKKLIAQQLRFCSLKLFLKFSENTCGHKRFGFYTQVTGFSWLIEEMVSVFSVCFKMFYCIDLNQSKLNHYRINYCVV